MTPREKLVLEALNKIASKSDGGQILAPSDAVHMVQIARQAIAALTEKPVQPAATEGMVGQIAEAILEYAKEDQVDGSGELFDMMSGDLKIHVGDEDGLPILIDSHRLALSKLIARRLSESRPVVSKEAAISEYRQDELDAVMYFIDKWFEPNDSRLKDNPATRAASAREIALRAIESQLPDPSATSGSGIEEAVKAELTRAITKFPTWPTDPFHALAVLGEEVGELTQAVLQTVYEPGKSDFDDVRKEAVQVAAMAIRFIRSLDVYKFQKGEHHEQIDQGAKP